MDATFTGAGADLKDLYFLTGLRLIDSGEYRLSGALARRGSHTGFTDLVVQFGQTDVRGTVAVDSTNARPHFTISLDSRVLRLADLGARAAGRDPLPRSPLLLSDAMFNPLVLRIGEADLRLHADELRIGRLPIHAVSATAVIAGGVLTATPISGELFGGRIGARLVLDARTANPTANVDLDVTGLEIGQIPGRKPGPPPLDGTLRAQVHVTGTGRSVHQVAATADGTVSVQIPQGAIRESLAELTGVDLRGLGLLLAGNQAETPLRCAVATFRAQAGALTVLELVADTDPVLITGEGRILLRSEALDLTLHGQPKNLRLFRLRAPIQVRGTLDHPAFGIDSSQSKVIVVDRGTASKTDCTALLAKASPAAAPAPMSH